MPGLRREREREMAEGTLSRKGVLAVQKETGTPEMVVPRGRAQEVTHTQVCVAGVP